MKALKQIRIQVDTNNRRAIEDWIESMQASGYELVKLAPSQLVTFAVLRETKSVAELMGELA